MPRVCRTISFSIGMTNAAELYMRVFTQVYQYILKSLMHAI